MIEALRLLYILALTLTALMLEKLGNTIESDDESWE